MMSTLSSAIFEARKVYLWGLVAVFFAVTVSLAVSLQMGLAVALLIVVGWWAWLNPAEGFLFLVAVAPILPLLKVTQTISTVTLIKDVLIFVLFARVFVSPLIKKQLVYRRNYLFAPIFALAIWTLLQVFRADSIVLGVLRAREIGLYVLIYFVTLFLPVSRRYWAKAVVFFSGSVLAVVLLGWYQWFFAIDSTVLRYDPNLALWIPRISSVLGHPSVLGHYLLFASSLALGIFLYVNSKSVRGLAVVFGLLMLPTIYLTYSRAVWLGVAVTAVTAVTVYLSSSWIRTGRLKLNWKSISILTAIVGVLLYGVLSFTRAGTLLRTAIDPTYASNEERLIFMARLISPLSYKESMYGLGLGDVLAQNFREVDVTGFDIASGDARGVQLAKNKTLVDNQYLKTLVEMGLFGVLIYVWIFIRFAKYGWRAIFKQDADSRIVGLWAVGFLASFVLQGFFIDVWDIFPTNALFWILAGVLGLYLTPPIDRKKDYC